LTNITRHVRRAALLAGAVLAASAGILSASAMTASASVTPPNSTVIFHTCTGIGNDGTTRGVLCADLLSFPNGRGTTYFGRNEVYCQNLRSRGYVRCAGIHETPAIGGFVSQPVGDGFITDNSTFGGGQQICGARFGHSACAVGEDVHVALEPDGFFAQPGGTWTCGFWGESVRTSILPPSGHTVSREVLATPHHDVNCGGQHT
jgi:hypothetical protein